MRMWRTMFSISTMASSTRIPVDSVMARKETRLSEKPSRSIAQNAGKIDSGSEIAAMMVARMSRRNNSTMMTARMAPSNKRRDRGFVIALGEIDRGVDQFQVDVGIGDLQRVDALLHGGGDHHVAGALGALDAERHHRLAVEAGEGAAVGDGVGDGAEIVEPHLAAAEQRDHGAGELVQRLGAGQRADRLVVLADLGAAAGEVDIGAAQALADIDGGQPCGLQPVGIERDQNLALDTADALDLGDAAHALQRAFDDVVDEVGQLLRRLAGRDRGIGDDRQADDVDALDQRLVDVLRQVGAARG